MYVPFTLYHLGPVLVIGYMLRRSIHWPTFLVASIIIDIEPLLVLISVLVNYPLHGYLHTILASIIGGTFIGIVMHFVNKQLKNIYEELALIDKPLSIKRYIIAGIAGWLIHILYDAPLYN